MTDVNPAAGDQPEATPAPQAPVLTAAQIEEMVARKAQEISDRRIGGLQSTFAKENAELKKQLQSVQRSLAGQDDDPRSSDLEAELRRQERENRYLKVALENPDLAPFITRFDPDASPEDVATALKEYRASFAPAAAPPVAPEPAAPAADVPGVEPNNPRREPTGWEPGTPVSEKQADEFFAGLSNWPGLQR